MLKVNGRMRERRTVARNALQGHIDQIILAELALSVTALHAPINFLIASQVPLLFMTVGARLADIKIQLTKFALTAHKGNEKSCFIIKKIFFLSKKKYYN